VWNNAPLLLLGRIRTLPSLRAELVAPSLLFDSPATSQLGSPWALRSRLATGLPFSLAPTDAHALLRMHRTQVPSVAPYLLEDYLPRGTMPPGCFASRSFPLMSTLLPRGMDSE
jgi:hypothetical protein